MSAGRLRAVVAAEWIKLRTVRASLWSLLATLALSAGLAVLVGVGVRNAGGRDAAGNPPDPLAMTFYSLTIGQLGLVVFAAFTVTAEYSTGTIRAALAAVPHRGLYYTGKLAAGAGAMTGAAVVTVLTTFGTAQVALGRYRVGASTPDVPRTIVGAVLYLLLIGLFTMGVATMLRSGLTTLGILLPLFFLGAQGLGNVPGLTHVTRYLPDQAGEVILHLTGPPGDPRFGRPYGPWGGLGIMALWTAAALAGGYLVLRRRDA